MMLLSAAKQGVQWWFGCHEPLGGIFKIIKKKHKKIYFSVSLTDIQSKFCVVVAEGYL